MAIAAGASNSVALKNDGTVVAWGDNSYGECNVPPGLSNVVALASGGGSAVHFVVVKADGTLAVWGSYLGKQSDVPPGMTNAVAAADGAYHALALISSRPLSLRAPVSSALWDTNGFIVSVPSRSGRVYCLEYKTSLGDPAWTPLPLMAGNGGTLTLTDPTATGATRFYRVRQW